MFSAALILLNSLKVFSSTRNIRTLNPVPACPAWGDHEKFKYFDCGYKYAFSKEYQATFA